MKSLREKIVARLKEAEGTWSVAVEDVNNAESFSINENESFYAAIAVPGTHTITLFQINMNILIE
ncbi:hypothetical protein QWT69_14405 [Sporosarcina oncorhynchi]|uniref:Uncharacterized protein n=1 Tax=Sporosarcina oncorhynchi TaxID=3056444 RepID=A0ABZ0L6Q3_9BACL|nr:hypothetical protein [Sporosarcina sp. T2O-4]WOV87049.1 hypothetical protein QWT69_14405 [Sporosarcina sp. T2O-4]